LYANFGTGFHSNDGRGTTINVDSEGNRVDRVTPLVRAKGGEVGVRSVVIPHLQTTLSLWTLYLDSELVYNGDVGATEPGPASARRGVEFANYYSPTKWLTFDLDLSLSRARFTEFDPAGDYVPEAVNTVVSAGASMDNFHRASGSIRLRYFGPRPLTQDNSAQSKATSLVNVDVGYQIGKHLKVSAQIFNLFNTTVDDIDYFFASRLPGEPLEGIEDIHFHPSVPRSLRVGLVVGF
jgi:outer membrane receptor protein involved in Fe transport